MAAAPASPEQRGPAAAPRGPVLSPAPRALRPATAFLPSAALAALLLGSCARPGPRAPEAPPLPVAELAVPDSLRREPAVVLADSTSWRVLSAGGRNRLERRSVTWYRIQRRHPALLETLVFPHNEVLEDGADIRLDAWHPDGKRWSATGRDLKTSQPRGEGLHVEVGGTLRTAVVPRYGEGLLLRIETVRRLVRPEFHSLETLRGSLPCLRRHAAFRMPADAAFRVEVRNREGLPLVLDTARAGGDVEVRVSAASLPRILPGRGPGRPEDWYAALHFSVPPAGTESWSWTRLGDHYLEMMAASLAPGEALTKAAAGLPAAGEARALAAFRLVKGRVRYLADSRGLHAWVPRPPAKVWDMGYGDCKEMANLLRVLLARPGAEAGIALVRAGEGPQAGEGFPALDRFDHAVLWRRRADGSVAYLDPTRPEETGADSYLPLLGRKVLRVAPGASAVDTVRPGPGYRNRVVTSQDLRRGPGGGWELAGTVVLEGKAAQDLWNDLRFREAGPEAARARVARLLERLGLRPRELSWRAPRADSAAIAYVQDAGSMAPGGGSGSVRLDAPGLLEPGHLGEEQEGDWEAPPFAQEDAWILPEGFRALRSEALEAPGARGAWTQEGRTTRRRYVLEGLEVPAGREADRRALRSSLERFAIALVGR